MLFLFAVLATVSAAVLLIAHLIRQNNNPVKDNEISELPPPRLRPLFEPTADEIRAFESEEAEALHAETRAATTRIISVQATIFGRQFALWSAAPTKQATGELLRVTVELGDAIAFAMVSFEIIRVFREGRISGLTADDLAALLDSHYRLLPAGASGTGELFRLKQEIAELRSDG